MRSKSKRVMTALLAVIMLLSVITPISAFAADVTMDLSKAEVSWDYTLTDAEGNAFTAAYGLTAANNPFGYAIGAYARKMHDYSVTLTDTNNVLSKYRVTVNGGATVSVNGNTMTISSTQPLTDAITIKLNRRMPATTSTTGFLIWSVVGNENGNQDMVSVVLRIRQGGSSCPLSAKRRKEEKCQNEPQKFSRRSRWRKSAPRTSST